MTELRRRRPYRRLADYLKRDYPVIITIGRFGLWGLARLRRSLSGAGGIALLVIIAFFVAGALVAEPLRWYLIGIASALLLLCGGVLTLSYATSLLSQSFAEQRRQIAANSKATADIGKQVADVRMEMAYISRRIASINAKAAGISKQTSDAIVGRYERSDRAHINESALIAALPATQAETGVMIDVGAMHGLALAPFLHRGWQVFAFEPDPSNRKNLETRLGHMSNLKIDNRAVADRVAGGLPFYCSPESPGISSLHPFLASHKETCTVSTTTIAAFVREKGLQQIDYLKIDTEGYDLLVLKGVPWDSIKPAVIMCEFEDRKTRSLGYTMHDMARCLVQQGYTVLVSEWHPVVRYGIRHDWHRLVPYPCQLTGADAQGNLLAFRDPPDLWEVATAARRILRLGDQPPDSQRPITEEQQHA